MKSPHHGPTTPENRPKSRKANPEDKARKRAEFAGRLNQALDLLGIRPFHRPGVVAEVCGVSLPTAMRYLTGQSKPAKNGAYTHLAKWLEVPPEWLFDGRIEGDGRALDALKAHSLFLLKSVPASDRAWFTRLQIAVNNGSRRACEVMGLDLPPAQQAAIYKAGVKNRQRAWDGARP